jgi:hypothetical protein
MEQRVDSEGVPCLVQDVILVYGGMYLLVDLFDDTSFVVDPEGHPRLKISLETKRLTPGQWEDAFTVAEELAERSLASMTYAEYEKRCDFMCGEG